MTQPLPTDVLEQRAAEQRRRLHNSVVELRTTVRNEVREKLNVNKAAREHFWPAAGALSVIGLVLGYGLAGVFVD